MSTTGSEFKRLIKELELLPEEERRAVLEAFKSFDYVLYGKLLLYFWSLSIVREE